MNFKKQVAVITGGGSGVGFAVAFALAEAGAKVIIMGRNIKKLKQAQEKINFKGKCEIQKLDVSSTQEVKKVFTLILKKYKRIDILVNCAGLYGPIGPFHTNSLEQWNQAFNINFFGTINCVYAALPFMLKAKQGKIINLSGGGAVQPFPNFSCYATAKAAIVRFSENIAKEYENKNIQVNCIAPGAINTSVLDQVIKTGVKMVGKEFYEKSLEQQRTGGDRVETAAELVLFLCSAASANITGKLISAKWDPWQKWRKKELAEIKKRPTYTLRRIDNKYFKQGDN